MDHPVRKGQAELRAVQAESRALCGVVCILSLFVNLLMLTGPLYLLNVYDRVLNARSVETLVALTGLMALLFAIMGVLDHVRSRIMARIGARFQTRLDGRVFDAVLRSSSLQRASPAAATGLADLEAVQRLITSPALMAVFDLPWVPLFFAGICIFHPLMGVLAAAGIVVLICLAMLNRACSRMPLQAANAASVVAERIGGQIRAERDTVQALGMRHRACAHWQEPRTAALAASISAADTAGSYGAVTRSFRLFLQSAMLGLGAYLVLQGQLSPGAMIAASILLGRTLAPVETIMGQWGLFQRGREGWRNLAALLGHLPPDKGRTGLPRPQARLNAEHVSVVPPGESHAVLRMISFDILPGQAVGVIGPSGAGKSTLARALTGVWQPVAGQIRLGGAALDQYDPDVLGQHIGYLPQRMALFDGTVRDNIARLTQPPDDAKVVQAAQKAAAHDMILTLSDGYDTMINADGKSLSGGQIQRIGLARALYGDPIMLVLDEPNASLDHDGTCALNRAVRDFKAAGGIVLIMAHRPAAIQECDLLLVIDKGMRRAFGPRDKVLAEMVRTQGQPTDRLAKAAGMA
ncbi:type I secretion system permease/ATPase [Yoonia sp.]|uniref:type I secretion system permease/ATPase n=1 Tax=Yoonia sp. TaxID=2212373 RepID=UPI00391CAD88